MKTNPKQVLGAATVAALVSAVAVPAVQAQSLDQLRSEVFALEQRINELENEGRVRVPNGTILEFGGYAKLDFIYDFEQEHGDALDGSSIRIGAPDDGGFNAHVRQSRFNFRTTTDTAQGPLRTLLEFDFFGSRGNQLISNSHTPRLRHAYGEWNGWLAGQNWSLFMPIAFGANTVDFGGPVGVTFIRQAQLRYTFPQNGAWRFAVSAESSEFSGRVQRAATAADVTSGAATAVGDIITQTVSETTSNGVRAEIDDLPDFVASADWSNGTQSARAAVLLRSLNSPNDADSDTGWGLSLAGATPLWAGGRIAGSVTYGDGIGRYIVTGVGQDALVDTAGNLNTIESWGAAFQVTQQLSETFSAGLAYGYYGVEDTFSPTDTDNIQSIHASLFYRPNNKVTFGGEVIWSERELVSGAADSITRLQTSVQFNF